LPPIGKDKNKILRKLRMTEREALKVEGAQSGRRSKWEALVTTIAFTKAP